MEDLRRIQKLENIKLLADARRLEILRFLMAAPETLSTLGHKLGEHPARVRHHLKALEDAGFVELVAEEPARGFTKKFYRACARAFLLQELILPDLGERPLTVIGSHDLALDLLAERMRDEFALFSLPVGSLDGLVALRQGVGHLAGSHLFDDASGEYNRPIVRLLFPDRPVHLFTLAHRVQGLLTAPGNPRRIQSLTDVAERNLTFINRNR
ncbi:MAG TPA: substrate-binding domain-containing protein, partial [Anaerolineales bacterium]|nr:substrate-binding domain-containing protein [Anaerolineales bacterium]